NSPAEYTREKVGGKTVVFTTTNGTRAMQRCKFARRMLMGAFVNFSAVCRELAGDEKIALVCAGTDGHVTREDTLLAGAIVDDLTRSAGATAGLSSSAAASTGRQATRGTPLLNDQALLAVDAWRTAVRIMTD